MRRRTHASRRAPGFAECNQARQGRNRICRTGSEATDRARAYFTGYPPSSPSIAILRDGKLIYMMQRHQIETRDAAAIAADLKAAFEQHCAATVAG